jgi:hypothetical protein
MERLPHPTTDREFGSCHPVHSCRVIPSQGELSFKNCLGEGPPYACFPTAAFNLVNLYLGYQINPDALASFSIENLLDEQYSRYLNVAPSPGHGLNSTPLPFFSPGITVKAALTVRFGDLMFNGGG